jgi:hypothetical protein
MELLDEVSANAHLLVLPGLGCQLIEDRIPAHNGASRHGIIEASRLGAWFIANEDHQCVAIIKFPQMWLR